MDIHKPKPWHSVREFLKEYLIIVIGVLTALGAEQIAENIHWAERTEKTQRILRAELAQSMVGARIQLAQEACEYDMLDRVREALLQPGDDWTPPYVIARPDGQQMGVIAMPIGGFNSESWRNAQADGTANHFDAAAGRDFSQAYEDVTGAHEIIVSQHAAWSELNALAWPRRLDPGSRTIYLGLIMKLRENVRLMAVQSRSLLDDDAPALKVPTGKLEDYGPPLKIYQGICSQFRAGKTVIVVAPPARGA
jgi:hypothetical protein